MNVVMLSSGKEENKVTDMIPCLLSRKRSLGDTDEHPNAPSLHQLPSFKAPCHYGSLGGRPSFVLGGDLGGAPSTSPTSVHRETASFPTGSALLILK